jgi:predicted RNA-binding protein
MCESNAYLIREGTEELVMENVNYLEPEGETIVLRSIFGEETVLNASLKEINLTRHRIALEPR